MVTYTVIFRPSKKRSLKYYPWVVKIRVGNDKEALELRYASFKEALRATRRLR